MTRTTTLAAATLILLAAATQAAPAAPPHTDPAAPCFRWPAVDMDGDGIFDRIDHCVSTPKGCIVDAHGCHADEDGDGVCDGVDRCPGTPPNTRVEPSGCPAGNDATREAATPATTPPTPPPPAERPRGAVENQLLETGRLRLENVYFESGSARLLPESESTLRDVGETLERYPQLEIEIQGHTDTRGRPAFNRALSHARAEAVRDFLLQRFRLDAAHLTARGYGETQPETRERNDEEMLRNRRVELHVKNPEALPPRVRIGN